MGRVAKRQCHAFSGAKLEVGEAPIRKDGIYCGMPFLAFDTNKQILTYLGFYTAMDEKNVLIAEAQKRHFRIQGFCVYSYR